MISLMVPISGSLQASHPLRLFVGSSRGLLPLYPASRTLPSKTRGHLGSKVHLRQQLPCASIDDVTVLTTQHTEHVPPLLQLDAYIYEKDSGEVMANETGDSSSEYLDSKFITICDKLIEVFLVDKPTTDWRRLLAFSKEWSNIRPHFYNRCHERAGTAGNPELKHKLLRLGRKLKKIDDDVQRHDELLAIIRDTSSEIRRIVSMRRKDFTKEFFMHLHTVAESYYEYPAELNALAKLGNTCLAAVQAYDNAAENIEALNAAELKFNDILKSPTLDAACKKIDTLAEKQQLDSALMLMITKAWSAAKESNMAKDEAKDVLYHLYTAAVGNLQRQMPKEVRILKYLLTIEDPELQLCGLKDAFTPGAELEGEEVDYLYTTPENMHTLIANVVDVYHFSEHGTLIWEARDLMNPKTIQRLELLKQLVQKHFL